MSNRPQIDREALATVAAQVIAHPQFAAARGLFCRSVTSTWLAAPLRRILITDSGTMGVAIAITGMNRLDPVNGAQLKIIVQALEGGGLASGSRVRNQIDLLINHGAVVAQPHPEDGRRVQLRPTPLLLETHLAWLDSVLPAVAMVLELPVLPDDMPARLALAERYAMGIMMRQVMDGFTVMDGFPDIAAFMNRRHGYLLMLQLARRDALDTEISRAEVARDFGVSPAHIAAMLADAEAAGWLMRDKRSSAVELAVGFADRLDLWVAREFAIVMMWLQAKLGGRSAPPPGG